MATHDLWLPTQEGTLLQIDHLPDDVQDLVTVLESEAVPLQHWWDVARAYLAQGRTTQYLALLQSALEPELLSAVEDFFKRKPTYEIVQLNCGYAAYHIEQFRQEQNSTLKNQHFASATLRINAAKNEGPEEQLPYLANACLYLAKVGPLIMGLALEACSANDTDGRSKHSAIALGSLRRSCKHQRRIAVAILMEGIHSSSLSAFASC